ncbi:uncharacterized protein LOC133887013 [Phragmites australis]|uniref:uncharacterized protein LOC133887013 n=1 Tax=Phragmites australis TaxID=29695 RepID=UPI002D781E7A|nr:uncharacterized protein LOC133887013 [Phragmites australis]
MPMASRASALRTAAQGYWRQVSASRSAATAAAAHPDGPAKGKLRGEYVPVYVALGLIVLSVSLGLSTARQQLAHSPNVRVDKKKRETVPEVAAPDLALEEAERFVGKSFFRKVAHVQDDRRLAAGVADPVASYPTKKAVTLKDVGVDTPEIEKGREGVLDKIFKKKNDA